jgi:DNA mismatch endonuclease (patch repair protein)
MDSLTKEKRSWNMSRIRNRDTKPELLWRSLLHQRGYRFRVNQSKLPGKPDIVLPKYSYVIFVNGCFCTDTKAVKISDCRKPELNGGPKKSIEINKKMLKV